MRLVIPPEDRVCVTKSELFLAGKSQRKNHAGGRGFVEWTKYANEPRTRGRFPVSQQRDEIEAVEKRTQEGEKVSERQTDPSY